MQQQELLQHVSLSLLQAGLDTSGEGSATQVLRLHSALFFTSIRSTRKSSMLYFTTSIHLFLCLPLLRCPRMSASKILLTQSSSSRRCTCPNHLNQNSICLFFCPSVTWVDQSKMVQARMIKSSLSAAWKTLHCKT